MELNPGLSGKTVIVTGGASGIGEASALLAGMFGCNVVVADINEGAGQQIAGSINNRGPGRARFHRVDVAHEDQVETLVDTAVSSCGTCSLALIRLRLLCHRSHSTHRWRSDHSVDGERGGHRNGASCTSSVCPDPCDDPSAVDFSYFAIKEDQPLPCTASSRSSADGRHRLPYSVSSVSATAVTFASPTFSPQCIGPPW